MPIYEYQCQACEQRLERLQGMSDPPLATCPECGGELRKLISAPAFQFKGSGWYVTDYARKGADKGAETKSGDGGSSAGSAEKAEKAEKTEKKESKAASSEGSKSEKEPAKAAKAAGA